MVEKIRCDVDDNVWVRSRFSEDGGHISVVMAVGDDFSLALLTPTDARKLRKQIKKALEAIEGVESGEDTTPVEEPKAPETSSLRFKVGDKVRIVGPASYTDQSAFMGQVREVSKVDSTDNIATYDITGLKGGFSFWFPASSVAPA